MNQSTGIYDFVGFSEIAETTTQLLSLALQQARRTRTASEPSPTAIERYVLQQARDYLSTVREGFTLSVRTTNIRRYGEMRFLLDRVLTDWEALSHELGIEDLSRESSDEPINTPSGDLPPTVQPVRQQLLAFGMAVIAMGYMPRLPSKRVTFPQSYGKPPTYRDIPVPRTPAEMLDRIEEMEEMVWHIMSTDLDQLVQRRYGPLRRTYGFFETSAWLSSKEVKRFGMKKRSAQFGAN